MGGAAVLNNGTLAFLFFLGAADLEVRTQAVTLATAEACARHKVTCTFLYSTLVRKLNLIANNNWLAITQRVRLLNSHHGILIFVVCLVNFELQLVR